MNTYQLSRRIVGIMRSANKVKALPNDHELLSVTFERRNTGRTRAYVLSYDTAITGGTIARWDPQTQELWVAPPITATGFPAREMITPAQIALLKLQSEFRANTGNPTQLQLDPFHKKSRVYG